MVRPSSLTRQLIAAIGLAALLVNGALQCHAWCLLTDCGTEQSGEEKCCQKTARKTCGQKCGKRTTSEENESRAVSHREGCPNPEQCVCCRTPAPQQAPTPVDSQAVVGSMLATLGFAIVVPDTLGLSDGLTCFDSAASSRSFDVCVKLCRFVV